MSVPRFAEIWAKRPSQGRPQGAPFLGLYVDPPRSEIPATGFATMTNFHLYNDKITKYAGWAKFLLSENDFVIDEPIIFALDFVKGSRVRQFIFASKDEIWLLDRNTNSKVLVQSGFTGAFYNRWQHLIMNEQLILTNGVNPPQLLAADASTTTVLSSDPAMPENAKYAINSVNHAVLANTTEGGNAHPNRVRWSDIDDFTLWTPDSAINEAGYLDIDDTEIRNLAPMGPGQFQVYSERNIYTFTYVGFPLFYTQVKTVNGIGLFAPYSLVVVDDVHYFLGTNGFYKFNGIGAPVRIGTRRVDSFIYQNIRQNSPEDMYGFVHPIYPEIWWVFRSKTADFFDSVIVYNWEQDVWAYRNNFPHSFLAEFLQTQGRTWADATGTWEEATISWREKTGEGVYLVLGGDETIYLHGFVKEGDGVPILGILETGDLIGRNAISHLSRVFYDIQGTNPVIRSQVGLKFAPGEELEYSAPTTLDSDMRHDIRLTGKIFGWRLETEDIISLTDWALHLASGGDRV